MGSLSAATIGVIILTGWLVAWPWFVEYRDAKSIRDALVDESTEPNKLIAAMGSIQANRGDDAVVFAVCRLLRDREANVRLASLDILASNYWDSWYVKINVSREGTLAVFDSAKELLADPEPRGRQLAAEVIGRSDIGAPAIPYLLKAIKDEDSGVSDEAKWWLKCAWVELPSSEVIQTLRHNDPDMREVAASTLGWHEQRNSSEVVLALVEVLKDSNAKVRRAAVYSLGEIRTGAKSAIPALEKCLADNDEGVRYWAERAIHAITTDEFMWRAD